MWAVSVTYMIAGTRLACPLARWAEATFLRKTRGIGYFVEALIPLALFCKEPLGITLRGMTNNDADLSVDTIRTVTLPLLRNFGVEDGLDFKVPGPPPHVDSDAVSVQPYRVPWSGCVR